MRFFKSKQEFGWTMYDWGNSAFSTTIVAGLFPVFFKEYWSHGAEVTKSTAALGLATSVAGLIVVLIVPLLGAIADRGGYRKKFLVFFCSIGILAAALFAMVGEGDWRLAAIIYVVSTIGFSGSLVFYDSLLPEITTENRLDFVSSLGYALGYLGGGLLFVLNLWMILRPAVFGIADSTQAVKLSFISVAIWWGVFTLPLILTVSESKRDTKRSIKDGFNQLLRTFKKVRYLKVVFLFLIAYWFYIDGVFTIIHMAVDYGLSIGLKNTDLLTALLITQFVGFPCAIIFGVLGEKFGAKRSIHAGIIIYMFIVFWAMRMTSKEEFYILAAAVGLAQGGVQALSRSLYARLIPRDQSAEFFGFFNLIGKSSVILGPLLMGGIGLLTHSSRIGIASILLLLVIGFFMLFFVNEKEGRAEVKYL